MQKMINKKAQSHVEVIISFIIFIGFLLFLFIFLNPFAKPKPDYILEDTQRALIENISSRVGKLSIITGNENCYDFNEEDYEGHYIEVKEDVGEKDKYTIYFNDIFQNNAPKKGCSPLDYSLGSYSEEDMVVYEKIEELKTSYESNYENLKNEFGLTNDFLFLVKDLDGEEKISVDKKIPLGVNVKVKEIPIAVINNRGEVQNLILIIKTW